MDQRRTVEICDFCRKPKGLAKAIPLKVKPRGCTQKGAAHEDLSYIPTHKAPRTYRQLVTNFSTCSYVRGRMSYLWQTNAAQFWRTRRCCNQNVMTSSISTTTNNLIVVQIDSINHLDSCHISNDIVCLFFSPPHHRSLEVHNT